MELENRTRPIKPIKLDASTDLLVDEKAQKNILKPLMRSMHNRNNIIGSSNIDSNLHLMQKLLLDIPVFHFSRQYSGVRIDKENQEILGYTSKNTETEKSVSFTTCFNGRQSTVSIVSKQENNDIFGLYWTLDIDIPGMEENNSDIIALFRTFTTGALSLKELINNLWLLIPSLNLEGIAPNRRQSKKSTGVKPMVNALMSTISEDFNEDISPKKCDDDECSDQVFD